MWGISKGVDFHSGGVWEAFLDRKKRLNVVIAQIVVPPALFLANLVSLLCPVGTDQISLKDKK